LVSPSPQLNMRGIRSVTMVLTPLLSRHAHGLAGAGREVQARPGLVQAARRRLRRPAHTRTPPPPRTPPRTVPHANLIKPPPPPPPPEPHAPHLRLGAARRRFESRPPHTLTRAAPWPGPRPDPGRPPSDTRPGGGELALWPLSESWARNLKGPAGARRLRVWLASCHDPPESKSG
jgi:hypothetical protein